MVTTTLIGALLVVCGVLYMAGAAIYRGRMTEPHASGRNRDEPTLEPRRSGLGFLSLTHNWPGLVLAVIGVILLLVPVFQPVAAL